MKRLVSKAGDVTTVQMDGYIVEERLLDRIMIQISDKGGNLEIAFRERDQRYLAQFSPAQQAQWLDDAMLHAESGCALETLEGEPAWIIDAPPPRPKSRIRTMRPARQEPELPPGLAFLRRS
jgi:hypothetical protein